MARYDKYDPVAGGFRALLDADFAYNADGNPDFSHADLNTVQGVSLNANGRLIRDNSNFVGVVVLSEPKAAGEAVDVMTAGEIVEMAGLTAGTLYYAIAGGGVNTTNTNPAVGFTVEATRLVVRV